MRIIQGDPSIADLVKQNGGYCPCMVEKSPDTKCMCRDFRDQKTPGPCHCGLYVKVVDDNG